MTVKNPYQPPTYGVRHLAIERRMKAGEVSANDVRSDQGLPPIDGEGEAKEAPAPANKAARSPANKGKK